MCLWRSWRSRVLVEDGIGVNRKSTAVAAKYKINSADSESARTERCGLETEWALFLTLHFHRNHSNPLTTKTPPHAHIHHNISTTSMGRLSQGPVLKLCGPLSQLGFIRLPCIGLGIQRRFQYMHQQPLHVLHKRTHFKQSPRQIIPVTCFKS